MLGNSLLGLYAQSCPEIIGYFPNWQWYDRAQLLNPMTIQYEKYSIINYAFFKPETNGSISSTDAWADQNLLLGQINWSTSPITYYPNTSIIERAHNANTKVLPSIGGSVLAESPASGTLRMINQIKLILNHVSPPVQHVRLCGMSNCK